MDGPTRTDVIGGIVERTDLDVLAERVLDSFWDRPDFGRGRPPRDEVRWNIDLVIRWLAEERGPTEAELDVFREQARARAADGTPADLVPGDFRRAARFAWAALLEGARDGERPALVDSADLLLDYVDQVSRIFSAAYEAAPGDTAGAELLPELLLLSSPRLARRLRALVYDPLEPELARTLEALIEHDFERAATAAAIPVHRNTLRDRLKRITELTGVDLDTAQGRALAWLAWLENRLG